MILHNVNIDLFKDMSSGPRPGHKYIRRWWTGDKWEYEYASEPSQAHGAISAPDLKTNPQRAHTVEVLEHIQQQEVDPERAYEQSLEQELSTPGSHLISHPTEEGKNLNVEIRVSKKGKQTIRVSSEEGKKKDFTSRGAFVRWYLGSKESSILHDHEGRPWLVLVPNIGQVEKGKLNPSKNERIKWILRLHESHPEFAEAKAKRGKGQRKQRTEWYARSRELAIEQYKKELRNRQLVAGDVQAIVDQPTTHPSVESSEALEAQEEAAAIQSGQTERSTESIVPGSVVDRLQRGQFPYRLDTVPGRRRKRRVLDIPSEQKEQMVEEIARQFWPSIISNANSVVRQNPFFRNDPDKWLGRFIGGQSFRLPQQNEMDSEGKPTFVGLESGSMAHKAILDAIESYDPSKGYFASYLAGRNGKLFWNMRHPQKIENFIAEVKASAPLEIQTRGGETLSREELIPAATTRQTMQDLTTGDEDEEEVEILDPWVEQQDRALEQAEAQVTNLPSEVHNQLRILFNQIRSVPQDQRSQYAKRFEQALHEMGLGNYAINVQKSIEDFTIDFINFTNLLEKAIFPFKQQHKYSHREGDENNPIFFYIDSANNLIRYTNAPVGHEDFSGLYGKPEIHISEPDITAAYYTTDGQKLDRCPPEGCFPEWNQFYNRYDPQNMWAARWPSPENGEYRYAYIESNIRALPKLKVNRMNVLHDSRLPFFRQYVYDLFHSDVFKNQMTALALALLDQGAFRVQELAELTPAQIYIEGSLIQLGARKIYGGPQIQQAFQTLKAYKSPTEPLFCVPIINKDGTKSDMMRRMGPNYWSRVIGLQGLSLLSFQTYRASKTFSREIQRLLTIYNLSWDQAVQQSLLTLAMEWGHDLTIEDDSPRIMQLMMETLVDPVLVDVLKENTAIMGLGLGQGTMKPPPPLVLISTVSMEVKGLTSEEVEFSEWLHTYPIHMYSGLKRQDHDLGNPNVVENTSSQIAGASMSMNDLNVSETVPYQQKLESKKKPIFEQGIKVQRVDDNKEEEKEDMIGTVQTGPHGGKFIQGPGGVRRYLS